MTCCDVCGKELFVGSWPFCPHEPTRPAHHSVHASERSVVYYHSGTGKAVYPGRNDVPMPDRYRNQGYERREFHSLRSLEKFEREQGVRAEVAHFDKGSGRAFDTRDIPDLPKETMDLIRSGKIR